MSKDIESMYGWTKVRPVCQGKDLLEVSYRMRL